MRPAGDMYVNITLLFHATANRVKADLSLARKNVASPRPRRRVNGPYPQRMRTATPVSLARPGATIDILCYNKGVLGRR